MAWWRPSCSVFVALVVIICSCFVCGHVVAMAKTPIDERAPRPPRVVVEPRQGRIDVHDGETFVVRCYVEGNRDSQVQWTRRPNKPLPPNAHQRNGDLIFCNAKVFDTGEYFCTSTNEYGAGNDRLMYINVTSPASQNISIEVEVSQEFVKAEAGEFVRVKCSACTTLDNLTVEWYGDSRSMPSQHVIEEGELHIPNAQPEDSGIYWCRITDLRTRAFNQTRTEITIIQYKAPTVQIQPDRQTITQGANAEFFCCASGNPPPTLTWTKVNEPQSPRVSVEYNVLRISNAWQNDRGTYTCTAANDKGRANATAVIKVELCPPGMFACDFYGTCLHDRLLCSGLPYCREESQEPKCSYTCPEEGQVKCRDGRCVDRSRVCDTVAECLSGNDQVDCTALVIMEPKGKQNVSRDVEA